MAYNSANPFYSGDTSGPPRRTLQGFASRLFPGYFPEPEDEMDPRVEAQRQALGEQPQPTTPSVAPKAPSMSRPQGGTSETPNQPEDWQQEMFDPEGMSLRGMDPMEAGQKAALRDDSHIRFKLPGGEWQTFDSGRSRGGYGAPAVGANASPEEWRGRVANPEMFEAYGDSVRRAAVEDPAIARGRLLTQDPFADQNAAAGRQLGVYRGMRDIDRAEMRQRSTEFMRAMEQEDTDYREAKDALQQRFTGRALEERLSQLEADHASEIERIQTGFGFGARARNDAFVGLGRG